MKNFQDKVVVITGAGTGIGFALARQFRARGAMLVLAARRRDRLAEAAAALGPDATAIFECDVTDRDQVEKLADFAVERFGGVDAVVNNAGVGPIPSTVINARREDIQKVLDVNLFGAWNGMAVFGKLFVAQQTPSAIYNVGSENCFFNAVPFGAGYAASKHALLAMTVALREELPEHVEVALICPGLVQSELSKETEFGMDADKYAALVMEQIADGRFFVVSHAFNAVRIAERYDDVFDAYRRYAPRYSGDDEFDVRTLGRRLGWYPEQAR